jgi:2-dehydro-3-deoxyphosphogluconate aldolase/(4S)-4-hydroxy-2-oxoglutarate aldolase
MARYTRIQVCQKIFETGMLPIFYHKNGEVMQQALKACYDAGVRVFEFTNRGDFAHEIFAQLEKWATVECPDMILGVGTIVDAATAALYIQCGANFVVGPSLNPDIFKVCNRRQIAYVPGCGSISEIGYAQELGAEIVKIFPAGNVGGPSFVKNMKAPMPWTRIMVTGGVETTEENLSQWFKAGVDCVGIGSSLFPKETVSGGDWAKITDICKNVLSLISKIKSGI